MSSTRFLRSEDHSRNDAHAIAVTSSWQELLSAQTRQNLSDQEAVTAASLFDQRNSVPSRHIRWRMTASLRATATRGKVTAVSVERAREVGSMAETPIPC